MLLTVLLAAAAVAVADDDQVRPSVTLPASSGGGTAEGVYLRSALGHRYAAFRGIPYALPPVGDLRFRPPTPHPGWAGVRNVSTNAAACAQVDVLELFNGTVFGDEDCLHLSVYRPDTADTAPRLLPVMVWIHGGGFMFGSGRDDFNGMDYLMDGEVVVVSINYRLSIFGFLTTDDAEAPGNYGLLDQVMALRWVQSNIAAFGGDPRRVTIFGMSAGGASVSLLVVSPLARGLFHRAISQSGSALAPWVIAGPQNRLTKWYAKKLKCPAAGDSKSILACLRKAPMGDIMKIQDDLGKKVMSTGAFFRPRLDSEAQHPLLPDHPRSLLIKGDFNRVPWITGVTESESIAMLADISPEVQQLIGYLQTGAPGAWVTSLGASQLVNASEAPYLSEKIATFYQRLYGNISVENLTPYLALSDDWVFNIGSANEAQLASQYVPVYRYVLDHTGPGQLTMWDMMGKKDAPKLGVGHGDDMAYLFRSERQKLVDASSPEYTMISLIVSLWTNFARLGYPTTSGDVFPGLNWPVFNSENRAYLKLNSEASAGTGLFQDRMDFWQSLSYQERWTLAAAAVPKEHTTSDDSTEADAHSH